MLYEVKVHINTAKYSHYISPQLFIHFRLGYFTIKQTARNVNISIFTRVLIKLKVHQKIENK